MNTVSRVECHQSGAHRNCEGLLQGQPPPDPLVGAFLTASLVCSRNKDLYCAQKSNIEDKASGFGTAGHTDCHLFPAITFVPPLIAESWLEWCEERLAVWAEQFMNWGIERKRGMKQGSWSLLVIRNWTASSCFCSAQGWMSKQRHRWTFLVCIHFYCA